MAYVPMVQRTDEDSCTLCNGYGGVIDDEAPLEAGMPHTLSCPECHPIDYDLLER